MLSSNLLTTEVIKPHASKERVKLYSFLKQVTSAISVLHFYKLVSQLHITCILHNVNLCNNCHFLIVCSPSIVSFNVLAVIYMCPYNLFSVYVTYYCRLVQDLSC